MENVVAFNNELSGLYDSKPPISKAKMAAITKAAMRAIKFYKHVVQSVEKFILKCKPEYKVPGLYVIDSIVRQSRHQYGPDKDVFAPRFARNVKETFANLFRCAPEDKSRIIRVLNLWQKNSVFAPEVIQPIFDLADPNHPIYQLPPPGSSGASTDMPGSSNGLNNNSMNTSLHASGSGLAGSMTEDKMGVGLPDLSNNNLKQLLNDPNVLRQLQTLQNFQKFKQQEDKQHKLNEMRMQDDAFEKHIQNVLKGSQGGQGQDSNDFNAEVEFVSMEQNIEVINLDGNDSRSPTPDRDRYKSSRRRSRTRSRSRDRRGNSRDRRRRSRSASRSPRATNRRRNSRERDRNTRDKERDREHERERRKKGLPDLKKEHLSVCSTTLWVGHLSKLVYQEELSDTFGEFGDIVSIDQIVPRGCAFIVMNRRQDAYKAMQNLKNHKLQGRAITISWAAGKGVKSKEWKDYWDLELGVTYIPWNKLDESTDFDSLEEGGMFDEDSMPTWMKDKIAHIKSLKDRNNEANSMSVSGAGGMMFGIDTTQPPPGPPPGPPAMMSMVPGQFAMAPPMGGPPRPLLGPMGMPMSGLPMPPNIMPGMPPPHPMMVPTGMMPPGFPPIPTGGPPPPQMNAPHLGLPPPNTAQYPAPAGVLANTTLPTAANSSSDDQMDIEMDEDDNNAIAISSNNLSLPPQMNFNQPPPLFAPNSLNPAITGNDSSNGVEMFSRDRNRSSSRWGSGAGAPPAPTAVEDLGDMNAGDRWRENGTGNFNENRNTPGRPLNIPPLDLNNPPLRPDFMNDFDSRVGSRGNSGSGPGPRGGDFFNNIQQQMPPNRFNQPTSLLQMRIPPPLNMFSPRIGGSGGGGGGGGGSGGGNGPMFMRGGSSGMAGGRQQGPGFFNSRNPFSNDGGGRGNARGSNGGNQRGGRGGRNNSSHSGNWSDDDNDDGSFKRRGRSGSRFGEANDDRNGNRGGGRRGGNDWMDRQRGENRDFSSSRNNSRSGGDTGDNRKRGGSNDDNKINRDTLSPISVHDEAKPIRKIDDTEEDWDRELEEYDARMAAQAKNNNNSNDNKPQQQKAPNPFNSNENNRSENNNTEKTIIESIQSNESANEDAKHHQNSPMQEYSNLNNNNNHNYSDEQESTTYNELPQPAISNTTSNEIIQEASTTTAVDGGINESLVERTNNNNNNNHNDYEQENTQATSEFVVADVVGEDATNTETIEEPNALETGDSMPE